MTLKREFPVNDELCLKLRPVSPMAMRRVQLDLAKHKPKPPIVEVMVGEHKQREANENDPLYLAELEIWEQESQDAVARYVFVSGVENPPPPEYIEQQREFFPDATPSELKFWWITAVIGMDRYEEFMNLLIGQTMPTEEGIKQAEDSFPSAN